LGPEQFLTRATSIAVHLRTYPTMVRLLKKIYRSCRHSYVKPRVENDSRWKQIIQSTVVRFQSTPSSHAMSHLHKARSIGGARLIPEVAWERGAAWRHLTVLQLEK